jgi:hypothetical protein
MNINNFPTLRDKRLDETTPEYLNYIFDTVDQAHDELLKTSPYYKIASTFKTKKPLELGDIKVIYNEVKRLRFEHK